MLYERSFSVDINSSQKKLNVEHIYNEVNLNIVLKQDKNSNNKAEPDDQSDIEDSQDSAEEEERKSELELTQKDKKVEEVIKKPCEDIEQNPITKSIIYKFCLI